MAAPLINPAGRVYGPPAKLKMSEPETILRASYGYGKFKYEHPKLWDIVESDLRKKRDEQAEVE